MTDVIHVQALLLHGEHILNIQDILRATGNLRPVELGNNDILGSRDPRRHPVVKHLSAACEALLIVGVAAQREEFDREEMLAVSEDNFRCEGDLLETKLGIELEVGGKSFNRPPDDAKLTFHNQVRILS